MTSGFDEQEAFWAGEFGDEYIDRNASDRFVAERILARTGPVGSVVELGSNIGLNLRALQQLLPDARIHGVEINSGAFAELARITGISAHHSSIRDFNPDQTWDLAFTKTVLFHLDPAALEDAYEKLYAISHKFILLA